MDRTTAFGYEQEDGNIHYLLSRELILDEIEKYLISRIVPSKLNITIISDSIIDYFSDKKFEQDKSKWRILYTLDGSVICKKAGSHGEFIYKKK
jgi:hypothetical protein